MAELWYGHFDSTPEDERLLLAADWARFIASFVTDGIRNGGTEFQVTPDVGLSVRVDNGTANILGYIAQLKTDHNGRYYTVELPEAHPQYPRVDRLVLRLDRRIQARNIEPVILMGTAANTPTPPALTRDNNVWELSLAQIRVNANAVNLTAANITDERFDTELCGIMNSALGLDPSAWQERFDRFLDEITETSEVYKKALKTDLDAQTQVLKADFMGWFRTIEDILDENAAGNLAAMLAEANRNVGRLSDSGGSLYVPFLTDDLLNVVGRSEMQTGYTQAIAVDETYLYYTDNSTKKVLKMLKTTFEVIAESPPQTGYTLTIAVDDVYLYYADYTAKKVIKMLKTTLEVVAESSVRTGHAEAIAIDDTHLYYADFVAKTVVKMLKTTLAVVITSPVQTGQPQAVAIDDTYVYYADNAAKRITKMFKSNLAVDINGPAQIGRAYSIAVDDTYLYYAEYEAKRVAKLLKTTVALVDASGTQEGDSRAIAIDDTYVYYADHTAQTVVKMLKTTLEVVATSPAQFSPIYSIAVDNTHVYCPDWMSKIVIKMAQQWRVAGYEKLG